MQDLKSTIIKKINAIQDEKYLEEIKRVLEIGFEEDVYQLNDEQIALLEEARIDIKEGKLLSNKDANEQIQEWLKRK